MAFTWRIRRYTRTTTYDLLAGFVRGVELAATITPADQILSIESIATTALGDCKEAIMTVSNDAVGFNARDWIAIDTSADDGVTWTHRFWGIIIAPGAKRRKTPSRVHAVGGRKALMEANTEHRVFDGADLASVAATLRNGANIMVAGMNPYGAVLSDFPVTGFAGSFYTNYASIGSCLDDLANRAPGFIVPSGTTYIYDGITYAENEWVPPVEWGMNTEGLIYFRRDTRPATAWTEGLDIDIVESIETNHEKLVTRVIFLATTPAGPMKYEHTANNERDTHGLATAYVATPASLVKTEPADYTFLLPDPAEGYLEATSDAGVTWVAFNEATHGAYISDTNQDTRIRYVHLMGASEPLANQWGVAISFNAFIPAQIVETEARVITIAGTTPVQVWAYISGATYSASDDLLNIGAQLPVLVKFLSATRWDDTSARVRDVGVSFDYDATEVASEQVIVEVTTLRVVAPQWVDTNTLDRVGAALIHTPTPEAAAAIKYGTLDVSPRITLTLGDGTVLPELETQDVEMRITTGEGIRTRVQLGARDDAEDEAMAELIRGMVDDSHLDTLDYLASREQVKT